MIWILMFLGAFIAAVGGTIYMVHSVSRFAIIKNKLIAFWVIIIVLCFFLYKLSWINALTIAIYSAFFFLFFGFVEQIVEKKTKKKASIHWAGLCAILCSILYLGIGYYLCVTVVEKDYTLTTNKNIDDIKIAMFADSHIGTTFDGDGFAKHLETIVNQNPDILLIPGDFVDDGTKRIDMEKACEALGKLNLKYGVYYAYGNHDEGYFNHRDFSNQDLADCLKKNGVHILEDESTLIDDKFYIVGRLDKGVSPNRKTIKQLVAPLDSRKYIIVLDHEPADYDAEAETSSDLVLSGHTHGGQMIPIRHIGVLVGVNDATYGYERRGATDFIVTSGISDWALKFKTGTRSEFVIIDIKQAGYNNKH
ncbi:MAG: metallophosphoesterase [Pseudobutyrivibrio sp.]|nr:metallophosphoesterase [Pseudobutyrivibrio sp.]